MKNKKLVILGSTILLATTLNGCTAANRVSKNIQANSSGLHRKVTVYSDTGEIIKEYEGNDMIVSDGDGGTITIDFEGKRVTICNSNVIIEEIGAD